MNSPPPVTAINQMLLQVVPGVANANPSGGTPNAMATIMAGALISGRVFGRDAQGNTQLETNAGMISLKMDIFIKRGVEVVLKMEQVQKEMFARIVSVDGKSLAKYMESIGATISEQDSIAHSSSMLQTATDKAAPAQTTQAGNATPKEVSTLLKAILVSPPLLDEKALEALPPEVKLALLRATIGATLKIEVLKLDLPLQIQGSQSQPATTGFVPPPTLPPTPAPPTVPLSPLPGQAAPAFMPPMSGAPAMPMPNIPQTALPTAAPITTSGTPVVEPAVTIPLTPGITTPPSTPPTVAPATLPVPPSTPHSFVEMIPELPHATQNSASLPTQSASAPPTVANIPATTVPVAIAHEELIPFMQNQTLSHILNAAAPSPAPAAPTPQTPVSVSAVTLLQEVAAPTAQGQTTVSPAPPPSPQSTSPQAPILSPAAYSIAAKPDIPLAAANATSNQAPVAAAPQAAPPAPPISIRADGVPVFTATVIASSSDSQVTLHTPLGTVKLFSPTQLPPGTTFTFTLSNVEPGEAGSDPLSVGSVRTFKGLEELAALSYPAIMPGTSPVAKLLPRAGAALTSEILFLLAALKGGDVRKWLGENNIKDLEKLGKADLLQRISQDFSAMRGSLGAEVPDAQAWTQMTLPLYHNGLHPIQWFQKHGERQPQEGNDPKKPSFDEHFLVDFHLTSLGHMQLDGLIKRENAGYSFDLTIRSEKTLPPEMRQHIKDIYVEAQGIGGFSGLVLFRAGLDACVPLESLKTAGQPPAAAHSILA